MLSRRVDCLTPNKEGLEKGKTSKYSPDTCPRLDPELFYPVREVKALVTETSAHTKVDMSRLNMKFFTEKRCAVLALCS